MALLSDTPRSYTRKLQMGVEFEMSKSMPPGVCGDINMLLEVKTVQQLQKLGCKMTRGGVYMNIIISEYYNVGRSGAQCCKKIMHF